MFYPGVAGVVFIARPKHPIICVDVNQGMRLLQANQ